MATNIYSGESRPLYTQGGSGVKPICHLGIYLAVMNIFIHTSQFKLQEVMQ